MDSTVTYSKSVKGTNTKEVGHSSLVCVTNERTRISRRWFTTSPWNWRRWFIVSINQSYRRTNTKVTSVIHRQFVNMTRSRVFNSSDRSSREQHNRHNANWHEWDSNGLPTHAVVPLARTYPSPHRHSNEPGVLRHTPLLHSWGSFWHSSTSGKERIKNFLYSFQSFYGQITIT